MTRDIKIYEFDDIASRYEILIFDLWGVIHDGLRLYDGVKERINNLLSSNKHKVYFLSNAPTSSIFIEKHLLSLGLSVNSSQIMTSGEQAFLYVESLEENQKVYLMGEESKSLEPFMSQSKLTQNIEVADYIFCTSYHDQDEDLSYYNEIFLKPIQRGVIMICANPDIEAMRGDKRKYCAGYFARLYESMGGEVIYTGKPEVIIYDTLASRINGFDKSKALMIGDSVETDIKGANNFGIDSALVLTGNTGHRLKKLSSQENDFYVKIEGDGGDLRSIKTLLAMHEFKPSWIIAAVR
jgi:HAD superfamily hydrolase (TIGR01459 family)